MKKKDTAMRNAILGSIVTTFLVLDVSVTHAADQATLDHLVEYAKQACLIGTQFDFVADVNGNVTFTNPTKPGAEGKASVNVRDSKGATAIFEEKLRVVADKQIQDCMRPYIDQIYKAILSPG
jgi:hypothetical protein